MLCGLNVAAVTALWLFIATVSCVDPPKQDYSAAMRQVETLIKLGGPDFAIRWPGVSEESQIIIQKGVARWIRSSRFKYLSHISPQEILAFATVPDTEVWANWANRVEGEQPFVILSVFGKETRRAPHFAPRIHGLFNIAPTEQNAFALWFNHVSEPFDSMVKRLGPV